MKTKIKIAVIAIVGICLKIDAQTYKNPATNTGYNHFIRNGGGAAVYINQVDNVQPILRLSSGTETPNQNVQFTVENNGNTGIGTVSPSVKLEIKSNETTFVKFDREGVAKNGHIGYGAANEGGVYLGTDDNQYALWVQQNGNIGIGTTNPKGKLNISSSSTIGWSNLGGASILLGSETSGLGIDKNEIASKGDNLYIGTIDVNRSIYFRTGGTSTRMFIDGSGGNVGIGTTTTGSHKLAVEGSIGAREIKVEGSGWSDFVFEKSYKLPSLENVEKHIKEKGHLQDIPSAKEVEKNGFFLGEMDAKLLQKIEELTLYTIQQEKEIKELKKQNSKINKQQKELEELKTLVKNLLKTKN
ncbi:hypothetical protein V1T75_00350 [Tenacibaculum sp. FZY0031]|uniref:hypothetical protein n=1 Tax=Tenacibaculum sp. FZY0031 TaxID=3116648 RepID=UPI002EC8D00C|nr:hypothetical protein [Tenacibaculum sp. FZY0031]